MEGEADAASESGAGAVLGEGANRGDEDVADLGDEDDPSDEDGVTLAAVLAEEVDSDLTAVLAVIWLGEVNVVGDVAVASDVALACVVAVVDNVAVAGDVSAVSAWWTQRSALNFSNIRKS